MNAKIEEGESYHVELNRLYEITKEKVEAVQLNASNDNKQLTSDVKEAQRLLRTMQTKVSNLRSFLKNIPSLNDRKTLEIHLLSHEKQLNQLQKKLKEGSEEVGKDIAAEERRSLLLMRDGTIAKGNIKIASHEERATRLQDLVARMAEQVDCGEQAMGSLVHSSSVLGQTQGEYDNHKGHITTGNKILSKYEQREFTEKVLLFIALLVYSGVVYYILQKRVFSWFNIF